MNITELARILRITPQELRNSLPQLGFDIGQKAIKINRSEANKIIKNWPELRRKIERAKQLEEEKKREEEEANKPKEKKLVYIPQFITVRELANIAELPINSVLVVLMKSGIFASLNEKIDFETAWLAGSELGLNVKLKRDDENDDNPREDKLKNILEKEKEDKLLERPPVIVVMGHVDHGKTKLLDAIRRTNVVDGEAGGITQHIGAYQVTRNKRLITFVDTPGHEAFTAMRSRGAKIADIAILVIAADDGVKPQTIEAFRIIKAAKIPYVVAINKIDKPEANIDKTKQELSSHLKIVPEDWGGKTVCMPISAKENQGITDLLDIVLLAAETEAENIKANPEATAAGTVIESNIDKGAGPVATVLIQNGTLRVGDKLTLNNFNIGKVRNLKNYRNKNITEATPATPVQILGLKTLPEVGDIIEVGDGAKTNFKKNKKFTKQSATKIVSQKESENEDIKKINIIIRSDVLGSYEAIEESLEKINTSEVQVKIVHKGLGNITDGDIKRAEASAAKIIGFNVKLPVAIEEIAREKKIEVKLYQIIYDLINDIKEEMQELVVPTINRVDLGRLKVLAIFRTEKDSQIIGGKIIDGKAEADAFIEVKRADELVASGKMTKLQAGKQDVQIAEEGQECGIQFKGQPVIEEGDILNFYKEEKVVGKI